MSCHDVYEGNDYVAPQYNMDLHLHLSEKKRAKVRLVTSHEWNSKLMNQDHDSRRGPS